MATDLDGKNLDKTWLREAFRGTRGAFTEVVAVSVFVNLFTMSLPIFILQVYDRVVPHDGISTLMALVIGLTIVLVFDFILRQTRARLLQWAAAQIDARLAEKVYDRLNALPLHVLERRSASDWQLMFRDVDAIRNTVCGPPAMLFIDLPFALMFIVLVFIIATPIAWVLAVAVPCFVLLSWYSGRTMTRSLSSERDSVISRDRMLGELLAGRTTVKALGLGASFKPIWEDRHGAGIEDAVTRGRHGDSFSNLGMLMTFTTTMCLTSFGALAILSQEMTVGALIAANMLSSRAVGPFSQLVGTWRQFAFYRQAVARLSMLFHAPVDRMEAELDLGRPRGAIRVEGVEYRFDPEGQPVLDGVDINIEAGGNLVALVGHNGSGKSTLLKLIFGLYQPLKGRILFDGGDIAQYSRQQMVAAVGYVPQDIHLFSGSVRENIALSRPGATDEEILVASKLAGVHDYIVNLPDGYGTEVGEGGRRLSGGERQRIAIARALLNDPPILLMDEPTSNLDQQATENLVANLEELARDRTVIVASHTMALLNKSRYVIALERGRLRAAGRADKMLPWLTGQPAQPSQPIVPPPAQPASPQVNALRADDR